MRGLLALLPGLVLAGCVSTRIVDTAWTDEMRVTLNAKSESVSAITSGERVFPDVHGFGASDTTVWFMREPTSFGEYTTVSPADVRSVVVSERNHLVGALGGGAVGILVGGVIGMAVGTARADGCPENAVGDFFCTGALQAGGLFYGGIAGGIVGLLVGAVALGPARNTIYRFSDRGEVAMTPGGLTYTLKLGR